MNEEKTTMHFSLFCIILCFSFIQHSLETWKKSTQSWDQESHEESGRTICCLFHLKSQMLFWFPSWAEYEGGNIYILYDKNTANCPINYLSNSYWKLYFYGNKERVILILSTYSNYLDKWCRECRRKIPWPGFYVEETFYINKCGRCYPPSSRLVRANQPSIGQCHCSQL